MYAIKEERTKQTDSRIRNQKSEKTRDNHINFPKTMQRKESSISPKEYFNQRIENSLGKHYNIVHTQEKNREYLAKGLIQKQSMETCQNKSMTFTNPKRLSLLSGVDFSLGASYVVQRSTGPADEKKTITYQTYTKFNPITKRVYSGRTSGTGSPAENVRKRDAGHHMNSEGYGPAQLDKTSENPDAIRGREQQLIETNGGAVSTGGSSGNKINGINKINSKKEIYLGAAKENFE